MMITKVKIETQQGHRTADVDIGVTEGISKGVKEEVWL